MNLPNDVMIVGAGPTGLVLALLLAARGIKVSVYERWGSHYPLPRAVGLSHESLRVLQATGHFDLLMPSIDLELSRRLLPEYRSATGEILFSHPVQNDGFSFHPPMIVFDQPTLELALNQACAKEPLVTVHRGWNAKALRQDGARAHVTFSPVNGDTPRPGEDIEASARYVAGCDGANSTIRDLLAIEVVDTGFSESWLVVDLETTPELNAALPVGQCLDPKRPTTLVSGAHGRRRFEFMLHPGESADFAEESNVWQLTGKWGCTAENTDIVRRAVYTFRGRWAKSWRAGRFFLAGDAAHQMPPFMGQGLNSGMRDVIALAWRFDLTFKGLPESILDSYTSERLPHVRDIVEQAVDLGRMICTTDPQVAAARDDLLRRAQTDLSLLATMGSGRLGKGLDGYEDDGHLTMTPLRLGEGLGLDGDNHARYVTIQGRIGRGETVGLFDDVVGVGKFVLLAKNQATLSRLSERSFDILNFVGGVAVSLEDLHDVDGTYTRWLEHLGVTAVLARPDFYIFGAVGRNEEVDSLVTELGRQLQVPVRRKAA
jgi:2-polyprenyl-6-methoxyphenol hydroxylase-like FAD-dependent oxidoreductase